MKTTDERLGDLETSIAEIAAQFSALRFVCDVMFANGLAGMSYAQAEAFLTDIASPYRRPTNLDDIAEDDQRPATEAFAKHLDTRLHHLRDRAAQIRAARAKARDPGFQR